MPKILFWNVNRKDLNDLVCAIANEHNVDLVILLENGSSRTDTLSKLRRDVSGKFRSPQSVLGRFHVFATTDSKHLSEVYASGRCSLWRWTIAESDLLIGAVHLVDRYNWDQEN